jgi:hypothetical protein
VTLLAINNLSERSGFRRQALFGSLFYLEQQSTAKLNGGLLIGGSSATAKYISPVKCECECERRKRQSV